MYIAETSEPGGQISPRPQNREIVNTKLASLNSHRESLVLVFFFQYLELCEVWLGWDR